MVSDPDRGGLVAKHIALWARTPFEWGKSDCMLAVGDYVKDATGLDATGIYRGKYDSLQSCAAVTGFHRDPVAPFRTCAGAGGLEETDDPRHGDVGVIDTGHGATGAICIGKQWAIRGADGASIGVPVKVLAAWRLP